MGGEMISLGAVEIKINESKVLQGVIIWWTAIPDKVKGECVGFTVSRRNGARYGAPRTSKSGIPPLMIPGLAFNVDMVPKLGSGKADFTSAKKLAKKTGSDWKNEDSFTQNIRLYFDFT
jgi:acyl-[acyl-carrier-protein]-phospholipid O-acyltransferase/long-chain-fatty-acid--[acyl-carrier-protein] ligase